MTNNKKKEDLPPGTRPVAGMAGGAILGAAVGGPVGAIFGAIIGGFLGACAEEEENKRKRRGL